MKIKVSFAENTARLFGRSEIGVDFSGGTLGDLLEKLTRDNQEIADRGFPGKDSSFTCSINDEIVLDLTKNLNDGDEVFIFLPVAGG